MAESNRRAQHPVQRQPIFALLGTNAISLLGSQMSALALPWFVLETTGSAARTGLVAAVEGVALFIAAAFAGPLIDRYPYKRLSVGSDLASAVTVGLVPLLHHTVGLAFWQLLILAFLATLLQRPGQSARNRVVPELAALANIRLERGDLGDGGDLPDHAAGRPAHRRSADRGTRTEQRPGRRRRNLSHLTSATEAIYQITLLAGPPIAGLLIAALGPSNVLAVDAVTFLISAGLVAGTIPPGLLTADAKRGRYLTELAAGFRFLWREGLILPMELISTVGEIFVNVSLFAVVLPVYARRVLGSATELGFLFSAFAVGALGGAAVFGAFGQRLSWRWLWIVRFVLIALPYGALAASASLPIALVTLAACGFANGATNPLLATVRFQRTPPDLRGRVFGPISMMSFAAQPVGLFLVGVAIEASGLRSTSLVLAILTVALAGVAFAMPSFRLLDAPSSHPTTDR